MGKPNVYGLTDVNFCKLRSNERFFCHKMGPKAGPSEPLVVDVWAGTAVMELVVAHLGNPRNIKGGAGTLEVKLDLIEPSRAELEMG